MFSLNRFVSSLMICLNIRGTRFEVLTLLSFIGTERCILIDYLSGARMTAGIDLFKLFMLTYLVCKLLNHSVLMVKLALHLICPFNIGLMMNRMLSSLLYKLFHYRSQSQTFLMVRLHFLLNFFSSSVLYIFPQYL